MLNNYYANNAFTPEKMLPAGIDEAEVTNPYTGEKEKQERQIRAKNAKKNTTCMKMSVCQHFLP